MTPLAPLWSWRSKQIAPLRYVVLLLLLLFSSSSPLFFFALPRVHPAFLLGKKCGEGQSSWQGEHTKEVASLPAGKEYTEIALASVEKEILEWATW